jgi:hypothetical protein
MSEPVYKLIVKVKNGVNINDRPGPDSQGALKMRSEKRGNVLYADAILNIDGVPYASLIPENPLKPEYLRVAERDHSIEYVEVIPLQTSADKIADALNRIADALVGLKK